MNKKCKIIKEVYKNFNEQNYKTITIFSKSFKATGEYLLNTHVDSLLTLKNAKLHSYATNCECENTLEYDEVKWLNIFGKDIIAFSFSES